MKTETSGVDVVPRKAEIAIPKLFRTYAGGLRALGLRICRSREDAEDLVQETFLRAFRKWHQFEGRSSPRTWLYSIATRACLRLGRKRSGEPDRLESLSDLPPSGRQIPATPSPGSRPDELVLRGELRLAVESAISRLPADFRLPFVLKDVDNLSVREVAQMLGLKEGTVKTRVHRARLLLRKDLGDELAQLEMDGPDLSARVCRRPLLGFARECLSSESESRR